MMHAAIIAKRCFTLLDCSEGDNVRDAPISKPLRPQPKDTVYGRAAAP